MAPSATYDVNDSTSTPERLCQIVTPVGMLGYGFEESLTETALQEFATLSTPTALILDSGSTDSGPSKLALGSMTCPRSSYERDLGKLLRLVVKYKTPLLVSSAGGDGSDEHVDEFLKIIQEIADAKENRSWKLKVVAIYSGVLKEVVLEKLQNGQITGCGRSVPDLTVKDVEQTPRIVAQMGPEPFVQALAAHPDADVIIGGRAYDPAPYIAWAAFHALKSKTNSIFTLRDAALGAFTHMGKIMECGGLCCTPKVMGARAVIYKDDSFDVLPLDPTSRCIPLSVAGHTLYEKTRPDILPGPGGYLDLANSTYTQLSDGRTVRVRGSMFHPSRAEGQQYTVKLEGAKVAGYRTLMLGSFKDPILIPQIHSFLDQIRQLLIQQHTHVKESWDFGWHVYGLDENLTKLGYTPKEVFVVGEAISESQSVATSLASTARVYCAHGAYPGQKATSGNFAMGIGGKFELETAECAEFSIYHLMSLEEGQENATEGAPVKGKNGPLFYWKVSTVGEGADVPSVEDELPVPAELATKITNGTKGAIKPAKPALKANGVSTQSNSPPRTLIDIAKVIRSKNAGPYEITLDVIFDNATLYETVKKSGLLGPKVIAELYGISADEIAWCGFFDAALAFKATIPRMRNGKAACSGGYLENDVHGSQQYVPLMELKLSESLIGEVQALAA